MDGETQETVRQEYLAAQRAARKPVAAAKPVNAPKKKPEPRRMGNAAKKAQRLLQDDGWDDYDEDWNDEENEEEESVKTQLPAAASPSEAKPAVCPILDAAGLVTLMRRCGLMWKLVESLQEKGSLDALQGFPCVPVEAHPNRAGLCLISISCAANKHMAAVEDFSVEEVRLLESLGVPLLRPGKKLRTALGLDRASVVRALCRAVEEQLGSPSSAPTKNARLHLGLKVLRLPVERALPLLRLVCSVLRRGNKKEAERALTLPIFPTAGGVFAVPVVPATACIITPSNLWDELLSPQFPDFLLSWEGTAGDALREFDVQRPSLVNFLANFCAPRAGLFDQKLSLHFLESVAAAGGGASRDSEKLAQTCEALGWPRHVSFVRERAPNCSNFFVCQHLLPLLQGAWAGVAAAIIVN